MKTLIAMMMVGCGAMGDDLTFISGNSNLVRFTCAGTNILSDGKMIVSMKVYEKDCEFKLCAFIKETVTTNIVFPQICEKRNHYAVIGMYLCEPVQDMNIKIIDVHKIKTLEFDYDGRRFVEILSDEIISTKRQRRVTTEEWVDE